MHNLLVQPDPGLFIWTIVTFLVLLGLLAKFAWIPLLHALESRQETIRKSLENVDQARQELERVKQESTKLISKGRAEADSIVANSRADAAKLKEELRQKAHAEAEEIIENAERRIQQETDLALSQVRQEAVEVSVMIASKLIRRNLSKADNTALIDEALEQIGRQES